MGEIDWFCTICLVQGGLDHLSHIMTSLFLMFSGVNQILG